MPQTGERPTNAKGGAKRRPMEFREPTIEYQPIVISGGQVTYSEKKAEPAAEVFKLRIDPSKLSNCPKSEV